MEKSLSDFKPGEVGIVLKVQCTGGLKRRIFDMGLTPGTRVSMRKCAPLGDPIELTVKGYELSLRKAEAAYVLLKVEEEGDE